MMTQDYLEKIRRTYAYKYNKFTIQRSFWMACMIILWHIIIGVAVVYAALYVWEISDIAGVIVSLCASFLMATRYRALANILHECVHNCFTKKDKHNKFLAHFICVLLFISLTNYSDHHWTHHKYVGDTDRDLEFSSIKHYRLDKAPSRETFKMHLKRLALFQHLSHYITCIIYDKDDSVLWRIGRLVYILGLMSFLVLGLYLLSMPMLNIMLAGVLLPLFIIWPTITYVMDILDHAGLIGHDVNPVPARNYTVQNPLLYALIFPRNDVYHLVHHLFPGLSTDVLSACHQELLKNEPQYAALDHTFKQLKSAYFKPQLTECINYD